MTGLTEKKSENLKNLPLDPTVQVESEIDRQIGDLVPQKARREIVSRMTALIVSETFSGPIAHPRHLDAYEKICPGAADRIISMAEKRNEHHINMEKSVLTAEAKDQRLGMLIGGGVFLTLIGSALTIAVLTSNPTLVAIFLGTAALGGIGLFIKGRNGS